MSKRPKQKISSIFKNNAVMIGKVAKIVPAYFFLMIAEGVIWGLINSASAVFSYNLLNAVDGGGDFLYAVKIIAVMAGYYLFAFAFDKWYWCLKNPTMRHKLHMKMHEELFVKARSLDLACFDDPEFYNDFVWAMNESDKRAIEVIEDTGKLINRGVAFSTMFGLLLTMDPIIAVILFLSAMVTVISDLVGNRISFAHSKEGNPLWRKHGYINRVYHLADYAKELRISRVGELMMREYDENNRKLTSMALKYGKKYFFLYGICWDLIGQLTYFAVILFMIGKLNAGSLAVGGFAAAVNVTWNIRWTLSDLIDRLTKYAKHSLYIEKYLEFIRFEPQIRGGNCEVPEFESLEFRDVSFSYAFASHPKYRFHEADYTPPKRQDGRDVLKHVSFTIKKGDKIAVVGYNGAGKTTLIKLVMRLYDPTEGEILYNGIDVRTLDLEAYRCRIGAVFQDFKLFAASIAENVMYGEYTDADEETVRGALDKADFTGKLETLEAGIRTHLTREFDEKGTNLSGGEAQKVAISRVFAREYPMIIMDEPSSALDPMAEYALNQSILHHTAGKTVIFISHRLSTTRLADKIYMFDDGCLVEEGSHAELLAQNGKYAEMFRVQSEKYRAAEA